jgi:hypothetical protein
MPAEDHGKVEMRGSGTQLGPIVMLTYELFARSGLLQS